MSLIAIGSSRGAPGATTLTMALAAAWPAQRAVLIWEADADGGVLAARFGLGDQPGMATLAAVARQGRLSRDQLWQHTQELPGGTPILVGAESAEQASVVLGDVGAHLAEWFRQHPGLDVIADVGRLSPQSPSLRVAEWADLTLVAARPRLEELRSGAHRLHALRAAGATAEWLLAGSGPYSADEVATAFGVDVAGVIPHDPRAAEVFVSGGSACALRRSMLMRAAKGLADHLVTRLPEQAVSETGMQAVLSDTDATRMGAASS